MTPLPEKDETELQRSSTTILLPENIKIVSDRSIITLAIDAVVEMERRCFTLPWKREDFVAELDCPEARMLLLLENTLPAGYLCSRTAFEETHINKICIHPEMRRRGYGMYLLRYLLSTLAGTPCKVFLEVARSNTAAIGLYECAGFRNNRVRKKIYHDGDDAFEMLLTVS